MSATTADGQYPSWKPPELGLARAAIGALLLVALIFGFIYWAIIVLPKPPQPAVIQVTQAQLTALPKPAPPPPPPPPPPKVVPPPKPLPLIAKPPPVESKIVIPTKPLPVHHYIPRPIKRVVPTPPQPVTPPTPTPPQPQAAPAPRTDGVPVYGSQMHDIIQANQDVPPALASLGVSGTAIIRITVAPDGHVISVSVIKSSGIPLIDQTALDHAMHAPLRAFNADMPQTDETFIVPVEIDATNGD